MPVDGLQIYGNIYNPLEPSVEPGPAPTDVEGVDEELTQEPEAEPEMGGGTVSPESARYFGPEGRCMNCIHFMEPGSCEIVAGQIDPQGICSLFTQDSGEDQIMEEAPPVEDEGTEDGITDSAAYNG